MTGQFDHHALYKDLGTVANDEQKRRHTAQNLAAETAAELHTIEDILRDLRGILNEVEVAQRLGNIPLQNGDRGSLAEVVVNLVKILIDISRSDFDSIYLSSLKKTAKKHIKELSKVRDSWNEVVHTKNAHWVKKQISAVYKDLIHSLRKSQKKLEHESKHENKEFKKGFTFG